MSNEPQSYKTVMNIKSGSLSVTSPPTPVIPSLKINDNPASPDPSCNRRPNEPKFILAPTPTQLGITRSKKSSKHDHSTIDRLSVDQEHSSRSPSSPSSKLLTIRETGFSDNSGDRSDLDHNPVLNGDRMSNEPKTYVDERPKFKKNDDGMDGILQEVNFEQRFASLPQFKPENVVNSAPTTPLPQLVASPAAFVQSYRKKQRSSTILPEITNLKSVPGSVSTPSAVATAAAAEAIKSHPGPHHPMSTTTPMSATPVTATPDSTIMKSACGTSADSESTGVTFFGPNFNVTEAIASATSESDASCPPSASTPLTPRSPRTPGLFLDTLYYYLVLIAIIP